MRSVPEWVGASDNTKAPPRVRQRVFDRDHGCCHICGLKINGKRWALDHVQALINGGKNVEGNLKPVHIACHAQKTAADVAEKAKVAKIRGKHSGAIRPQGRMKGPGFAKADKSTRIDKSVLPALPRNRLFATGEQTQ